MNKSIQTNLIIDGKELRVIEIIKMIKQFSESDFKIVNCKSNLNFLGRLILYLFKLSQKRGQKSQITNCFLYLRNSATLTKESLLIIQAQLNNNHQSCLYYGDSVVETDSNNKNWYESRPVWSPIFFKSHDFLGDLILIVTNDSQLFTKESVNSFILNHINDDEVKKIRIDSAISKKSSNSISSAGIPRLFSENRIEMNTTKSNIKLNLDESLSVIIPTKFSKNSDGELFISKCLESINKNAATTNFKVFLMVEERNQNDYDILFDNIAYRFQISKIVYRNPEFNFSKVINYGVSQVSSEFVLILNDDVYFTSKFDFSCPLNHLVNDSAGSVGIRLLYPDQKIQHAGIYFINGAPQHWLCGSNKDFLLASHNYCKEVSGSTGAFLLFRKNLFERIGGMDEDFHLDYNDVDVCLKFEETGHKNILCSDITAYHFESKTRGKRQESEVKIDLAKLLKKHSINSRDSYTYTPADRI
jgi:GT2 family glycosyltransferase